MIEEDLIAEEEIVISSVAVREGDNASNCPVCREEFDQFYKQVRDKYLEILFNE